LVEKSILTMSQGRRGRYALLETMRLFGAEQLREAGEDGELQRRHAAWYAELVTRDDLPWWGTPEQGEMFVALDREWANLEAALDFCVRSAPDAEMGLRTAADLWLYWLTRGRYGTGRRHLERLLEAAPAPSASRAMALWALGFLSQSMGDFASSLARFEEARVVSEQTGGDRELAYALVGLSLAHQRLGNIELAATLASQSRERMLMVGDPVGLALCLYFLATVAATDGRLADAQALAREGLESSERAGDTWVRGILTGLLGTVEWLLGDTQAAEVRLKEAVRIQDLNGHRWGLFTSLEGLAWVAGSAGRLERAALLLGASAALREEIGAPLLPYAQAHHDGCEASARDGLGESRFRARWEEGFALGREETLAAALEERAPAERSHSATEADDAPELTGRELEVARLVADGLTNPDIAAALFLSRATVKTHVSHILRKLGLESRTQLAAWIASRQPTPTAPPHP
jgi:non-specific serine/threonine protein kinase